MKGWPFVWIVNRNAQDWGKLAIITSVLPPERKGERVIQPYGVRILGERFSYRYESDELQLA